MFRCIPIFVFTLCVVACGGTAQDDAASSASPDRHSSNEVAVESRSDLPSAEAICALLSDAFLNDLVGTQQTIEREAGRFGDAVHCNFSWPRPDAEARQAAAMEQMMEAMRSGDTSKMSVASLSTDYNISVSATATAAHADQFIPPQLTEQQLQQRIDQASAAAEKRLTDEQKAVLGEGGAGEMAGKMIRAANKRVVVEGVGDAAYWQFVAGGVLQVLHDGLQWSISNDLADDSEGQIDIATKVARTIIQDA